MLGLEPNLITLECKQQNPLYQYDKEYNERLKNPLTVSKLVKAMSLYRKPVSQVPDLRRPSMLMKQFSGVNRKFTLKRPTHLAIDATLERKESHEVSAAASQASISIAGNSPTPKLKKTGFGKDHQKDEKATHFDF